MTYFYLAAEFTLVAVPLLILSRRKRRALRDHLELRELDEWLARLHDNTP